MTDLDILCCLCQMQTMSSTWFQHQLQSQTRLFEQTRRPSLRLRVSLWCAASFKQHDLVYISYWQPAVQVYRYLHHCVVGSPGCLHNCASCTWSLFWFPQILHEDTSQDLRGELGICVMLSIIRCPLYWYVVETWTEKVSLCIYYTTFGNKYPTSKLLQQYIRILWDRSTFCIK